ncbi:MAG TPA: 30S ribosomal protein S11 [Patescibacteria group bacterium]|nr:30S ribosomal protein S11 [Patescibacteria group bacterium]
MTEEKKTTTEQEAAADQSVAHAAQAVKKKTKRQVFKGQAHVQCTYNNTIISITDMRGGLLAWGSAGALGFKGAKKSTPYAATQVAHDVAEKTRKFGTKELDVYIKGVGSGREASIRGLAGNGFDLIMIKDITPIPHNGCRPRKPRRV